MVLPSVYVLISETNFILTSLHSILLAFFAYFGLGAYYNYSTYGARGIDLIPWVHPLLFIIQLLIKPLARHRDFWQEVPYMLKDVISHFCTSVHPRRSSRGGYVAV